MPKQKQTPSYLTMAGKDGKTHTLPFNRAARRKAKKRLGYLLPPLQKPVVVGVMPEPLGELKTKLQSPATEPEGEPNAT